MGLSKRSSVSAEFNMSSLTDIIFLLLIFFMLTSSLTSPNLKNLDRPTSSSTTPSPQNIALSVTPEGEYFLESELVTKENLDRRMELRIIEEREKNRQKGIKTEVTIVLNLDKNEPTSTIVEIMALSNKHKARLILATDP
ncbi:biopolymer transporter ExbD [Saprospira sp. CCB-QB6]|uniref:ExbD/TolR family protein n=1 Tax=Saprospira sp. CCB-QB6 TaxID=3023936 RepID=UPI00234A75DD|nr:biopolymer transporter ExbD [Saprospira sp. CCB-QB6]WCL81648.1 biopolymer transporter ExbD [Saprospira sp. CCB-QB6]